MFRLPDGISDFSEGDSSLTMNVSIPSDGEGFFGRSCPSCSNFFKLRVDESKAASETEVVCAYCGHRAEHSNFITSDQKERVISAARAYAVAKLQETLGQAFPSSRSGGGMLSISVEYKPGTPPSLHSYVEEQVRRTVICDTCRRSMAVYGAASFCPYCGPREVRARIGDEILAQRRTLTVFDHLPEDIREEARAAGVIDGACADALENVVTLFEQVCRETFEAAVPMAGAILSKARPNVFQNLEDADRLFQSHAGRAIRSGVDATVWDRLKTTFAKRHVLTHRGGIVDHRFLNQVPASALSIGQRLVIGRHEASRALDDLEVLLRAAF